MPQSIWTADRGGTIDGVSTTTNYRGVFDTGELYAGATKSFGRRSIIGFNLASPPVSGRVLTLDDHIVSAYLRLYVAVVVGPPFAGHVARIIRSDYDQNVATWLIYKPATNWTTLGGGGDVDSATPPEVAFTSPGVLGEYQAPGMEGLVADAIANRSGLLLVRLKPDVETIPGNVSTYFTAADLHPTLGPRIVVTYESATPTPIDRPRGTTPRGESSSRGARPDAGARHAAPAAPSSTTDYKPRTTN